MHQAHGLSVVEKTITTKLIMTRKVEIEASKVLWQFPKL